MAGRNLRMKAAVLYEYGKPLAVEDVQLEMPRANEVLVKIAASGICGSDLHIVQGSYPYPLPLVLGHEGAGVVHALGPGVETLAAGDHVVLTTGAACGSCFYCARGRPNICENMNGVLGGTLLDGTRRLRERGPSGRELNHHSFISSFAEYAVVPERACIKVRADAPLDRVSLLGCGVMTGVGAAINVARVEPGSRVAVFGCGGVGLSAINGAALAGAATIIAVDVLPDKLAYARQMGATHTVVSSGADPVDAIKAIVPRGVDYAFEAVGYPEVLEKALECVRPGGTCVVVGSHPVGSRVSLDPRWFMRDRCIVGANRGRCRPWIDIPMLVDLYMQGKLKLDSLVTHTASLDSINEAMDMASRGKVARAVIVND